MPHWGCLNPLNFSQQRTHTHTKNILSWKLDDENLSEKLFERKRKVSGQSLLLSRCGKFFKGLSREMLSE